MTGTSAFIMRWTIARVERSSPPGVSSWMTSAWARSGWARSMAMPTRRSVTGLITPSMSIVATGAGAADATLASASNATASSVAPRLEAGATEGGPRPARPGFIVASASRPARPRVARDRRDPDSSPQRQETDELEEEIRGEQRGDLAGAVVRGRHLDDIGAHECLPPKRPHQHERLVRCEPADLGRPGRGGECRIDGVDVERAVDRPAAEAAEPFRHPGGPLLLHRLDAHDLDPMLIVEGEVLGAVERTADPDLDHASRLDEPFLHGAAERRAVEELRAEVFVPRVGMGVEVHEAEAPVAPRERAQDTERHGMIAADADGRRSVGDHLGDPRFDGGQGALDGDRHDVHIAAVGHTEPLERVDLEDRIPRTDQGGLLPHRSRAEAGPGPVRGSPVVRDPQQGNVEAFGRGGDGQQHERRHLAESWRDERVAGTRRAHRDPPQSAERNPATVARTSETSSGELNTENVAREVPTTPSLRMSGIAQ